MTLKEFDKELENIMDRIEEMWKKNEDYEELPKIINIALNEFREEMITKLGLK